MSEENIPNENENHNENESQMGSLNDREIEMHDGQVGFSNDLCAGVAKQVIINIAAVLGVISGLVAFIYFTNSGLS
jgi:hypothetical protein